MWISSRERQGASSHGSRRAHEPDAFAFEPLTGLVVTTNEGSRDLTLNDSVARRRGGRVALRGVPEFAAAGKDGV